MYYVIADPPVSAPYPDMYVRREELQAQVRWLAAAGYEAVTLGRVFDAWHGRATLLPVLQREWSLSNSEAGLISGVYFAGYVAATPILTSLTDRFDSRQIYGFACLLSFLGAAGFTLFAGGIWGALFFQFMIGAGLGGTYMPGLKMLADQFFSRMGERLQA